MGPVALHVDKFGAIMALNMNTITMEILDLTYQATLGRHFKDKCGHTISIWSLQRSKSQCFVSFVFTLFASGITPIPPDRHLPASETPWIFTPEIMWTKIGFDIWRKWATVNPKCSPIDTLQAHRTHKHSPSFMFICSALILCTHCCCSIINCAHRHPESTTDITRIMQLLQSYAVNPCPQRWINRKMKGVSWSPPPEIYSHTRHKENAHWLKQISEKWMGLSQWPPHSHCIIFAYYMDSSIYTRTGVTLGVWSES